MPRESLEGSGPLQYSFDLWNQTQPEAPAAGKPEAFPFSEDLAELEASLSMPEPHWPSDGEAPPSGILPEEEWDQLAEVVAAHVMAYMQDVQAQDEIVRWQRLAEEYHADNRVMARQIQELIEQKDQLTRQVAGYEIELARYRKLFGNLHLRW